MQTPNDITSVLERMLPVGSIVEWDGTGVGGPDLSSPEKVAAYYGFGTWEAYGQGQMLLGVSDSHAVGSTGGEEMHTLTEDELPEVYGEIYGGVGPSGNPSSNGIGIFRSANGICSVRQQCGHAPASGNSYDSNGAYQVVELNLGGGQTHNNLPPYITVYRWRRIA